MNNLPRYLKQIPAYIFFMGFIAYLSSAPDWRHTEPENATIKVSIRHPGKIVGECRALSNLEIKNLPANMKVPEVCPRERSPVNLSILLDGELFYEQSARPSGLQKDGVSTFYKRFNIPSGSHMIQATLTDDVNQPDQGFKLEKRIMIEPRQVVVVDFKDGFIFK